MGDRLLTTEYTEYTEKKGRGVVKKLIYEDLSYKIRGALFEVYKEKGSGFLEDVYQECLEIELGMQEIPFDAQYPLKLVNFGHHPQVQIERIVN